MLKLKLQYFGHLMRRTDSFEKTLMLGNIEGSSKKLIIFLSINIWKWKNKIYSY